MNENVTQANIEALRRRVQRFADETRLITFKGEVAVYSPMDALEATFYVTRTPLYLHVADIDPAMIIGTPPTDDEWYETISSGIQDAKRAWLAGVPHHSQQSLLNPPPQKPPPLVVEKFLGDQLNPAYQRIMGRLRYDEG